jgi:hypothetical protein
MTKFTYLPREGDPDSTTVMRTVFDHGAPVEIDETTEIGAALANKLRGNPWFHEGEDAPPSKLSEAKRKAAADKRDMARQLWSEAYDLDPEGTEADHTPPEHVLQQQEVSRGQLNSRPVPEGEGTDSEPQHAGLAAVDRAAGAEGPKDVQGHVPSGP